VIRRTGRKKEIEKDKKEEEKRTASGLRAWSPTALQVYYPDRNVLDFADETGCGILTIVWPFVVAMNFMHI
jgi:hypothetical protein